MFMLEEDYRQVVAFINGCALGRREEFRHLHAWGVTRLRGVRDKFGWPYALAVLAADRVARTPAQETKTPLVEAYLDLVCEYLDDLQAEGGAARIEAAYEQSLQEYHDAHDAFAHTSGAVLSSPQWDEECRAWQLTYVPALRLAPSAVDPWG